MFRAILISSVVLGFIVPAAHAEKKNVDVVSCRSGKVTVLSASKEATILAIDGSGPNINTSDEIFRNASSRCIGTVIIAGGTSTGNGFCKYLSPSGDITLLSWTNTGKPGEGTWKYILGTGKWKGIKGGGSYKRVVNAKPMQKGTFNSCIKATGTYELPK